MTAVPTIDPLLAEPATEAAQRADRAFDTLIGGAPVVLCGAGALGRQVLAAMRAAGREPVCFADRAGGGRSIDGVKVLDLAAAVERFGDRAAFVVSILNPRFPFADVRESLHDAGCARVVSWIPLAWACPDGLLPYYAVDRPERYLAASADIHRAWTRLDDDASRREFAAQLRWRLTGDADQLDAPAPEAEQYLSEDIVNIRPDEAFVDCGAYDGDTLAAFVAHTHGSFGRYVALEPEPANLALLRERVAALPAETRRRVEVLPAAASSAPGTVRFDGEGTGAGISADGKFEVEAIALDDVLEGPVTYLKMDIEGAEADALAGAKETIVRDRPVLALCAYHRPDHLWSLLLAVDDLVDDYRFRMRRYGWECWEVVLYALPVERRSGSSPS